MIAHTDDRREVYYRTHGTGPELLLTHGGFGSAESLMPLVDVLSTRYRCVTFDRLGHRRSTHLDRNTTAEEQAAGMEAVHRSVTADPVWVFGHSSGGNFALAYAMFHPSRVKGLILMEPALYAIYPPGQKPREVEQMEEIAMPLFEQGQYKRGWAEFGAAIFGSEPSNDDSPPLTERDLDDSRAFRYDQPVVITWCPPDADLAHLTAPVLIIEGDRSPEVLRGICRLLDGRLGNSRLITLEGADHGAPRQAPEAVADALVDFVTEWESGG